MNYHKLAQCTLDIGEEMLVAGAEVSRVTDTIKRILSAYGCEYDRINAFVITANIQITFEAPDGEIVTQIRQVVRNSTNYDRLDYLNDLSRYLCANTPDISEIQRRYEAVMAREPNSLPVRIIGIILTCGFFTIFFGGKIADGLAAAAIGLIAMWLDKQIRKIDHNVMAKLFIVSIVSSLFSIFVFLMNTSIQADKVMIGVIMLLIPGIAITNSIRDLLIGDMLTGLLRLANSVLLALTIAIGFALPMLFVHRTLGISLKLLAEMRLTVTYAPAIQLLVALISTIGFSIFLNIKGKQLIYAGLGGFLTWGVYLLTAMYFSDNFMPNFVAALFIGFFAELMAKINRAPTTIFLTSAAIPLIPGSALYYATESFVFSDMAKMEVMGSKCIIIALAISLGFVTVAIFAKYKAAISKLMK